MGLLSELGLWRLGLSAILAATILPLSSEFVLSALLLAGENPLAVIIIATFGNVGTKRLERTTTVCYVLKSQLGGLPRF